MKKLITSLTDNNEIEHTSHINKADLLWNPYNKRLRISEFQHMYLDLSTLIQPSASLDCLEEPFTTKEIDFVVSNILSDKSPGPDGFNTDFLMKCWSFIK